MEVEYTAHRSMVLAVRKAVALYLMNEDREEDIIKITKCFATVDNYKGDRIPISLIKEEVDYICSLLQDNYLGLKLHSMIIIESLPFYKAINDCIKPFSNIDNELPFLLVSRLVFHFFFLITESMDLQIVPEKGLLRFDLIPNDPQLMNKHQIDGVMVITHRIVEAFCPGFLKSVNVTHRNSTYELEYYQTVFGVPVELAERISLVYDLNCRNYYKNATSLLIKSEEELGRSFFINPLFNMLTTQFSEFSYQQRCEIMIDTMIGMIPPTRSNVADAMNISVSTLQRRLAKEGTSFQEILDKTRKRLVKIYLAEKKLPTTDVAYLLGYQSHSQFFKVFKNCFSITPKAYQSSLIDNVAD